MSQIPVVYWYHGIMKSASETEHFWHIYDKLVVILNDKNLIPFSERTEEELREMRKNGGKKSGETRRRKRDLKNTMKALLEMPVTDNNLWNLLSQMGVSPENINNHTAIAVALMREAMCGNVKAFKEIRNLLGEDNDAELLKLKKQELKLKEQKQDGADGDGRIFELIEGLKDDIHE